VSASLFARAVVLDTSIVFARHCERDRRHKRAVAALESLGPTSLYAVNVTAHETFTRLRQDVGLDGALDGYEFIRAKGVTTLEFNALDEQGALASLRKYKDQNLSFHDALCASVMKRVGIYKIISLDKDFFTFGFEVFPGP
jgi:predicted nucleic acid-binding protein